MGPAKLKFRVLYEGESSKEFIVHISKDQDEADGMMMAIRAGKAENPYSPLKSVHFNGVVYDD